MVDVNLLRENPDKFKKAARDKGLKDKTVDDFLILDKKRRKLLSEVESLRAEKNKVAKDKNIEEGKKIKKQLQTLEPKLKKLESDYKKALYLIPNPASDDVKVGKSEADNEIKSSHGEKPNFDFEPKNHWELAENLDLIDTKRASKVSGTRFFYLKGDGVLLDQALIQFGFEALIKEGFTPIIPPVLIKKDSMQGMGYLEHGGEDDMFVLDKDNLVLVGTSEQAIGPMHMNETFNKDDLPKRYVSLSTCFRREAGSYGKDTKGAFRVHQFNKLEMFSFATVEESDKEHEYMLSIEEKLLQKLELPYQVVKMCTADLGAPAARKYDLEGWFPAQKKYRELTSTSTTTDFQSRRLNIKYMDKNKNKYVHMLNGTVFSQRPILAILENYQQKDGSIIIPKVLQKYINKDKIEKPK